VEQTDRFLTFNERNVLGGAGGVSHDRMESVALGRYVAFEGARREREVVDAEVEALEELKRIEGEIKPKVDRRRK
jgi:hypothetical protein